MKKMIPASVALLMAILGLHRSLAAEPSLLTCPKSIEGTNSGLAQSRMCLSCHDGSVARNVLTVDQNASQGSQAGTHPVAVSYAEAYRRDPTAFVPPEALDQRVQLFDRQVECVSCHVPAENGGWTLAKPNERSELCLSCHRK